MSEQAETGNSAPKGWNGRRLAIAVGLSVLMGALLFTYILWLYAEVERASAETTAAWRAVATEMAPRYGRIEKLVAEGVDKRQVAMEVGEQFRLRIDAFRATGQAEEQVTEVLRIEELLGKISSSLAAIPAAGDLSERWNESVRGSAELQAALESYNVRVRQQQRWRSSFGGAVLLAFIKLSEPREVRVVADLSNSRIQ